MIRNLHDILLILLIHILVFACTVCLFMAFCKTAYTISKWPFMSCDVMSALTIYRYLFHGLFDWTFCFNFKKWLFFLGLNIGAVNYRSLFACDEDWMSMLNWSHWDQVVCDMKIICDCGKNVEWFINECKLFQEKNSGILYTNTDLRCHKF